MAVEQNPTVPVAQAAAPDIPSPTSANVALFFLRLGTTAFGGPAAHIAMMEDELVTRRKWVERQRFLDLLAAANLIPGPSSTELAIYIGYELLGFMGLVLAGVCFILPAFLIVLGIAVAYVRYGGLPAAEGLLYGVKPVLIPILAQAAWRLGISTFKKRKLIAIGVAGLIALHWIPDPLIILAGCGALGFLLWIFTRPKGDAPSLAEVAPLLPALGATASATVPITVSSIFLVFLKIGAVIFGSGYVLVTFLRAELVVNRHWLSESQLLDSIAVGQVTPGPVFTTATFIGYLLAGVQGGVVATIGIFLPAFILVWMTGPIVKRMRQWPAAAAFLDGLNVGAIVLLISVTWELGRAAIFDAPTIAIAIISGMLLFVLRVNSTWLVLGGGVIGLILRH
jgi:chromate transporter